MLGVIGCRRQPSAPVPASQPAIAAVQTALPPPPPPAPIIDTYMRLLKADYRDFPATQPLKEVLDLPQAAHLDLKEPIYLAGPPNPELWITRSDAPPIDRVLHEAIDPKMEIDCHILRERVAFVHWMPQDAGPWLPYVVCRRDDGGFRVFWPGGHADLQRSDYCWSCASSWNERVIAPTSDGISILSFSPTVAESHQTLQPAADRAAPIPQALLDTEGVLAWSPWDAKHPGSGHAARFVADKWIDLSQAGWSGHIVHLVPLLDGSVLQLLATADGGVRLAVASLTHVQVDKNQISQLVDTLSDPDPDKRTDAYAQLTRYGPGIWPTLERLGANQPPEGQMRIQQLLSEKTQPTLGGMSLLGKKTLQIAARLADGGVVFYADDGVSIPTPDGTPTATMPAWISVRPGRPIQLLPQIMTIDLKPKVSHLWAFGDEWIVSVPGRGPCRFFGNGLMPLLRPDETEFTELLGIDHHGRWVLRTDGAPPTFLIIDPMLPDPTPRLPVWQFAAAATVGWDKGNWPVVKHDSAYALGASDWRLLDSKEEILTRVNDISRTTKPAGEPPLLVAPDGTRYFDGLMNLRCVDAAGHQTLWPLPAAANGRGPATLIRTADGLLYLFNEPGRVLRIRPTPGSTETFRLEATFTHRIPLADHPTRIWLDPAGRIAVEWSNHLALLFPRGFIPPAIAEKMQPGDDGP